MRPLSILAAVWGAALLFATPFGAAAQDGRAALASNAQALFMQVHLGGARAYAAPRTDAAVVAVYERNEQVMAVEKVGPYYRVVRPGGGSVGYVLGTELVPLSGAGSDLYPIVPRTPAPRAPLRPLRRPGPADASPSVRRRLRPWPGRRGADELPRRRADRLDGSLFLQPLRPGHRSAHEGDSGEHARHRPRGVLAALRRARPRPGTALGGTGRLPGNPGRRHLPRHRR